MHERKSMFKLGVDLGGTNIAVGIVNENYEIIKKMSVPTGAHRPAEEIVDDIAELCKKICAESETDLGSVGGIGVASPGIANTSTGVVEYANNLNFRRVPIAAMLREKTGIANVHIENDANAAALGEAVAGAAKGTSDSVMITLGTGVGGESLLITGF